jgi:hypothetical protein
VLAALGEAEEKLATFRENQEKREGTGKPEDRKL